MGGLSRRIRDYLKAVSTIALGRTIAGRKLSVLPGDIFLASYPKSGNTWIRFLIGNLISPEDPVTFANVEQRVPSIYAFPDRVLRTLPRILKSHECFDPRYPKVIYILRDPRDVAVSFYHYNVKVRRIPDDYPMDKFVARFVDATIARDVDRFGSWGDNVLSWVRMRQGKPGFILLRYEDILQNPERELSKVASMLQMEVTPERLSQAVKLSSADRMRTLEKQQSQQWTLTKDSRQDKPFIREARSGGWRKSLSETSVRRIEEAWGATMQDFGYELSLSPENPLEGHLQTWGEDGTAQSGAVR
jgi:hypothetical protein